MLEDVLRERRSEVRADAIESQVDSVAGLQDERARGREGQLSRVTQIAPWDLVPDNVIRPLEPDEDVNDRVRLPKIDFGQGVYWRALSFPVLELLARDAAMPLRYRVFFAAAAYADTSGHAVFDDGWLRDAVRPLDKGRPTSVSLSRAIAQAKGSGLLHELSHAGCLMLPHWAAQGWKPGVGGSPECPGHREQMEHLRSLEAA